MNYVDALREVEKAARPVDLFSDPEDAPTKYRELAAALHPDKNIGNETEAADAFSKLTLLWSEYQGGATSNTIIISSKRHTYVVDREPWFRGELANHYKARYNTDDGEERSVVLKMPRDPRNSDLMENEGFKLKQIAKFGDSRYEAFVPQHIESFRHRDQADGTERLTNVLVIPDGLFNLNEIKGAYPDGVDPKDAAWMWRRLLVAVGYAHTVEIVHGAVFPEHVLIQPEAHGLVLVDWCYAVDADSEISVVSKRHFPNDYPEEVVNKEPVNSTTDIYMATKCMMYLLGDRAPREMRAFAAGSAVKTMAARPKDAFSLLREFDELLRRKYGERKFHPFHMPERKTHG